MQFKLRTLFVAVTLVAVGLAWWKSLDHAYWIGWKAGNNTAEAKADDLYRQSLAVNSRLIRVEKAVGINPYAEVTQAAVTPAR